MVTSAALDDSCTRSSSSDNGSPLFDSQQHRSTQLRNNSRDGIVDESPTAADSSGGGGGSSEFRMPHALPPSRKSNDATSTVRNDTPTASTGISPRIVRKRIYPTTMPTIRTVETTSTHDYETSNLRRIVYEKEYENQERLSAILDRAESFIDRLERAGDFLPEQIWMASQAAAGGSSTVLVHDGVVVQTDDGDQYVQEDGGPAYQVNMI